jgi:hypothetical protein
MAQEVIFLLFVLPILIVLFVHSPKKETPWKRQFILNVALVGGLIFLGLFIFGFFMLLLAGLFHSG